MNDKTEYSSPISFRGNFLTLPKIHDNEGTSAHPVSCDKAWKLINPFLADSGVTRISDITHLDRIGIPVFNVLRPSLNGYSAAHGKGFTPTAAKLSAAGESLERWYGTESDIASFRSTWNELNRSYSMVSPDELAQTPHSFFHKNLEIPWTTGWDIISQEEVPLPLELVRLSPGGSDSRLMDLSEGLLFQCSSNGLSCGVHLLEAICQGLLEVIERDSTTCCTMAARGKNMAAPLFRVAQIESIPFPRVSQLINQIKDSGIEVILADNSTDVTIPTWNCFLFDIKDPQSLACSSHGMGSSLDHETAMIRAITEAVQARCVYLSGVRDIVPSKEFKRSLSGNGKLSFELMSSIAGEKIDMSNIADKTFSSFEEDVNFCIERLKSTELERVIVFCLSSENDPVRAVKIFVPGAEGYIFPYYKPGRRAIDSIRYGLDKGSPLFIGEAFSW